MDTIRINLEVPAKYRERIQRLITATGATTQAEVFRKAIATLETLTQIETEGGKLKATYADGTVSTLIFLL